MANYHKYFLLSSRTFVPGNFRCIFDQCLYVLFTMYSTIYPTEYCTVVFSMSHIIWYNDLVLYRSACILSLSYSTYLFSHVQVLATCERVFSHSIPDTLLSSLKTAEDVKNYFTTVPDKSPSEEVPLIPSIQVDNLPQNLSVQCVPVKMDKRPRRRIPFANYSDPRHAHFPTKQKVTKDWKGRPVRLKK